MATHAVGGWTEFRSWVFKNQMMLVKGLKGEETHLLLDGGRLSVPNERNADFLKQYARALFEITPVYVVEKKTKLFYMMAEFDIKLEDREVTANEIAAIVRAIQQGVMSVAFPENLPQVAVCTAPPKQAKLSDDRPAIQSGIHLIWRVVVDAPTAWLLRAWMLRELESRLAGTVKIATRWGEAFDACIFGANGLRLPGSRKAEKCPTCKGKTFSRAGVRDEWGEACAGCNGTRYIDLGRPYDIAYVADSNGDPIAGLADDMRRDPMKLVLATTIRAINSDGSLPPAAECIVWPGPELKRTMEGYVKQDKAIEREARRQVKKGVAKDPVALQVADVEAKKRAAARDTLKEIQPEDPVYAAIAKFVLTEFDGAPIATHIKKCASGDVYVITTNCHHCANKGGPHNHSNVYFIMRPSGCVQKCFCIKEDVQPVGLIPCARFTSKPRKLPAELIETAFSKAATRTARKREVRDRIACNVLAVVEPSAANQQQPKNPVRTLRPTTGHVEYKDARDSITPRFTPDAFLGAVSRTNFRIL